MTSCSLIPFLLSLCPIRLLIQSVAGRRIWWEGRFLRFTLLSNNEHNQNHTVKWRRRNDDGKTMGTQNRVLVVFASHAWRTDGSALLGQTERRKPTCSLLGCRDRLSPKIEWDSVTPNGGGVPRNWNSTFPKFAVPGGDGNDLLRVSCCMTMPFSIFYFQKTLGFTAFSWWLHLYYWSSYTFTHINSTTQQRNVYL